MSLDNGVVMQRRNKCMLVQIEDKFTLSISDGFYGNLNF